MNIKLTRGIPRGRGLFLVQEFEEDDLELVWIQDDWIFDYPKYHANEKLKSVWGWIKIEIK